jgi:CHAT domain-containing protein
MGTLVTRTQRHLGTLYDLLLRPIEDRLGTGRLVVVPHRALHYVPFHALYNGSQYIIEQREVSYAPSATMLHLCLARPQGPLQRALLVGVSEAPMLGVIQEVQTLAALFEQATVLIDSEATVAAIRAQATAADVLHLACHGQFRPDNPLFSSLRLGDGWLTVYDAYSLDLQCQLVTLSACETGMSIIAPGDELIGLTRGFFSTGAPSLLASLWAIDDESATAYMSNFYERLCAGERPAAALRQAQLALLTQQPHPFFWSPFILLGRW